MNTTTSATERRVWAVLAIVGGLIAGQIDAGATDVQGPALILMIINFAICLPGRALPLRTGLLTVVAMMLWSGAHSGDWNAGMLVALVPALMAAYGGAFAGRLLDSTGTQLYAPTEVSSARWYSRPMPTRLVLGIALVVVAEMSVMPAQLVLRGLNHPAAAWLGIVWSILTLLGWIGIAPVLLGHVRHRLDAAGDGIAITARAFLLHCLLVATFANVHAIVLVAVTGMMHVPLTAGWRVLAGDASIIYFPLDALAYLTILALGYASDAERRRRDAAQRETEQRLVALRARLNPHFLFNALNSVSVLTRGGQGERSAQVVDGLTALLRYVLDERRASVPLSEEISFVRDYLAIQQVRFDTRLRVVIDTDGQTEGAFVPQLLLQPIIENAVEHGVSQSLAGGQVIVSARRTGNTLMVVVEDDGPGPSSVSFDAGIGLPSTRERLERLYGDRASLTIVARAEGGTRVIIRLPFEEMREAA